MSSFEGAAESSRAGGVFMAASAVKRDVGVAKSAPERAPQCAGNRSPGSSSG